MPEGTFWPETTSSCGTPLEIPTFGSLPYNFINKQPAELRFSGSMDDLTHSMHHHKPIIVWFREDLRLSDHPALHAASQAGAPVICLFVLDEASRAPHARLQGGATRW